MNANVGGVAINPPGCVGLPLHASGFADPTYYSSESRPHSCKLNLGWQLADVGPDDGGFALIPVRFPNHLAVLPCVSPSSCCVDISWRCAGLAQNVEPNPAAGPPLDRADRCAPPSLQGRHRKCSRSLCACFEASKRTPLRLLESKPQKEHLCTDRCLHRAAGALRLWLARQDRAPGDAVQSIPEDVHRERGECAAAAVASQRNPEAVISH